MRTLLLTLTLLVALATAQWALDPTTGYRGWTLRVDAPLSASLSATMQLLPTPFWQEWVLGNWTTGFVVGRGCVVQGGPLRYGIYINRSAYVETPAVRLGQNFTVVAVVKPRYLASDQTGWIHLWYRNDAWSTYVTSSVASRFNTFFHVYNQTGSSRFVSYNYFRGFATFAYVGEYRQTENRYYMYIYTNGTLVAQTSFPGQRSGIGSSPFRLGGGGGGPDQSLWCVAFAVYNRSLTAQEVAAWRPEAPVDGALVMYYYAHPQFVRDVDGDGVLEWLDLSGNNRHAKLRGAVPQWFIEPVVLSAQRCGGVSLTATWDGFVATYAVNGTSRSVFEPGRVHFDGQQSYAVVPINFYGWRGLTIEQYVYIYPAQKRAAFNKFSCIGPHWEGGGPGASICGSTQHTTTPSISGYSFHTRVGNPTTGAMRAYGVRFATGRWQHIVLTFDNSTRVLRFYINGTPVATYTIPSNEYTVIDTDPSISSLMQRFVLASNAYTISEWTQIAYSYVRIYSRALTLQEVQHNYANPNNPVTDGLELWLHWDSFRGSQWLDKSGKGRHATVRGTVFAYPHWQWVVGAYLQHGYPAASPLVATDFRFNGALWTSGTFRGGAVALTRVDGAYIDAAAYSGSGWVVSRYVASSAALGFDASWTPSENFRGWITIWRVGATALNITQLGGHGVSLNSTSVRNYAGTVVVLLGDGLYVNGTRRVSLPRGANATSFALLSNTQGGLRALVRYAWLDAGVRYGANSSQQFGGAFGRAYTPSSAPSPWAYYVDFRWWPPVATWGILQSPSFPAVRHRQPSQPLVPATLSAAYATSQSAWGPWGEICVGSAGGQRYVYGVRHVWLSDEPPTCVLPLPAAPPAEQPTRIGVGQLPPVLPWQHPLLVNSVPRQEPWLVDYSAPYVDTSAARQIPYAARACAGSFCVQGGRAVGAYSVYLSRPGWALNKTGYVYVFNRFGVSIIDSVAYVAPLRGYAFVVARDAHLPGVMITTGNSYYNAWVEYEPRHAVYFPADGSYVEVGGVPMDRFTIVVVAAKPDRNRGTGSEFLWRGFHVGGSYDIYATLKFDDSTDLCIFDGTNILRCVTATNAFSEAFNVVAYVVDGGNLAVYVNGRLAASGSFTRRVDQYVLRFGERNAGVRYPFYVHAVYVYNRPLTYDEVQGFRLESPPRSGLAAWYAAEPQFFGIGRWFDASGNGRHATVVGNVRLVQVAWPRGVADLTQPAKAHTGPLPGPPAAAVQAIAAVYVETDDDVAVSTWVPHRGGFDHKTGGYGRGVIPLFGYTGDMVAASAKVDLAVHGRYAFLVRRGDVHVYSFATELSGSRLDVPIRVPYPGYYTLDVLYNGTRIRSGVYWIDQGGALYLGVLGPPLGLMPVQPVQPQTATPIYTQPLQPLEWLPRGLPLPAPVRSNPIEVSAAAALAVALAAAYVTYASSRRLELGLAAAIVAFFAVASILLPTEYRWMVAGWVAFLVTAAVLLIVYYLTR